MKYSTEQKAEALQLMAAVGISEAVEKTGISMATLFRWKKEAGSAVVPKAKGKATQKEVQKKKALPKGKTTKIAKETATEAARALLQEDDSLLLKIRQLQSENAALESKNAKLKKALAALLD